VFAAGVLSACAVSGEGVDSSVQQLAETSSSRIISVRGVVPDIDGDTVIVDVVAAVDAEDDLDEVGREILARQVPEAIPFNDYRYEFISITWDTLPVVVNYNGSGIDSAIAGTDHRGGWWRSLQTWNDVATSNFEFVDGGDTTRCPSLVKECGAQTFDGLNDVVWIDLRGDPRTLAVTWTGTSIDEADQAYNTKRNDWSNVAVDGTTPSNQIDFVTVAIHENGHSLGLGHSNVSGSIMEAFYGGEKRFLHSDDIDGVSIKYPGTPEPPCIDDGDCDDGAACNGLETCDTDTGDCVAGTPVDCGDGVACTIDTCDEVDDVCLNTADDTACDDGDVCTDDSCDLFGGCFNDPIPDCTPPTCGSHGDTCSTGDDCCSGNCKRGTCKGN
jgi:hypothetical protein